MTTPGTEDEYGIDTSVPHSARIWNYWLGGKDNYEIDQAVGDQVAQTFPAIVSAARNARLFLGRAVAHLAGEAGVDQFLDVGTGLPTVDNTHEVAQRVNPACRVVYVDNDPLVLTHARALLTSAPEGATWYLDADLYEPEKIIARASELLDFSRPVALMLMGIMGHVDPYEKAREIVGTLVTALPPGGYLALYDGLNTDPAGVESMRIYAQSGAVPYNLRSPEQIAGFFEGLELIGPGLTETSRWGAGPAGPWAGRGQYSGLCGVARKP